MFVIIWEYQVKEDRVAEFQTAYATDGLWAKLFEKAEGYLGTELFHDSQRAGRFVTLDRWSSAQAYEEFKFRWKAEYHALDEECAHLTDGESLLGIFNEHREGG